MHVTNEHGTPGVFDGPFALFEDNLSAPASALLLQQHVATLQCDDPARADAFFQALEAASLQGHWVSLVAHYELACAFEKTTEPLAREASSHQPLARALVFGKATRLEGAVLEAWWQENLDALSAQSRDAGVLQLVPSLGREAYATKAQRVLDYIDSGDCYQVNLSFPMSGRYFGHPAALYAKLRERQPVHHGALLFDGERWLLSRSPELFFRRQAQRITCRPMKGTAARGSTEQEDVLNAQTLCDSEKNRAENLMIVDLIRNDLGRLANAGKVQVEKLFELEQYTTVFQLTSTVSATDVQAKLGEIFRAMFPCGSVTGAPKVRAMQIISELEAGPRGPYCGALGWVAPGGDCSFNVPIRTLQVETNGSFRMNVGSGIVADSLPDEEYDECLTKARFITDDSLQLIETLRCEVYQGGNLDETYPLLAWHLQRLATSATELRFDFDEEATRSALISYARTLALGVQRVRLLLSRRGGLSLSHAALDTLPEKQTVTLARHRLDADDLRLRHKTTARAFYDVTLQEAMRAGHFDAIHLNTRGEVCEGARSNVFIERDGRLLTPPLASGVLPGVMRAQLLAAGAAQEQVLHVEDLLAAEQIFVGNALRGLVEVRLLS